MVCLLLVVLGLLGRVKVVGRFIMALELEIMGTFTLEKLFASRNLFRASSYEPRFSISAT